MSVGIGGGGGKSSSQQSTRIAEPSAAAQQLEQLQLQAAQEDAANRRQYTSSGQAALDQQLGLTAKQNLMDRLSGKAPVLSPAQQEQLNTAYGATQAEGLRDINQTFQQDAAARGLNVTDSPVADAKGLALGEFSRGLASSKASAALNLGQAGQIFSQGLAQYQDQLRMAAATNRMSTLTGYSSPLLNYGLGQQYGRRYTTNNADYTNYSGGASYGLGGIG